MDINKTEYLQPTKLCDFDRCSEIRDKARELCHNCRSEREKFRRIFAFIKELPYGLEDWDVTASSTMAKGWGMCSGKTNLLVAMLRAAGIPARYRVYRIRGEAGLWGKVTGEADLSQRMGAAPVEQDHVDCEVWLGRWEPCDPSRDTPMERGMKALGIPLERREITDGSGNVPYLLLASLDDWARERQARRTFREDREDIFARVNEQLERLRTLSTG